jgi:hypothetical protein
VVSSGTSIKPRLRTSVIDVHITVFSFFISRQPLQLRFKVSITAGGRSSADTEV